MKIKYNCTENDNHIIFDPEDGGLAIGDVLEKEWIIIGMQDLKDALNKFGYSVQKL